MKSERYNSLRKNLILKGKKAGGVFSSRKEIAIFSPGVLFLLFGIAVLIAPRFFLALIATFFVFVGILFCFVAWKFQQLKKKIHNVSKDFQGQVIVQGINLRGKNFTDKVEIIEEDSENSKKIIYH